MLCFTNLSCLVLEIFRFFEKHAQNLNTPQNNSARWDLQMGFNSAFKGLNYVLTHNLQTEFKEEFYKRICYMRPCHANYNT